MENSFIVRTVELMRVYRTSEVETTALSRINLEIRKGDFIAVMGPSGSGKTTLLNILGLLDSPTEGAFYFMGTDVTRWSERKKAELRKGRIGFIFQNFNLIEELTVFENVELPLVYLRVKGDERKQKVHEALERLGMAHRRDHFPRQLSSGQQQRVAVARAIVSQPDLLLADEPTGNLDTINGDEIMRLLTELNQMGMTIFIVTHDPTYAGYSSRVIHLLDGRIVSESILKERQYV